MKHRVQVFKVSGEKHEHYVTDFQLALRVQTDGKKTGYNKKSPFFRSYFSTSYNAMQHEPIHYKTPHPGVKQTVKKRLQCLWLKDAGHYSVALPLWLQYHWQPAGMAPFGNLEVFSGPSAIWAAFQISGHRAMLYSICNDILSIKEIKSRL